MTPQNQMSFNLGPNPPMRKLPGAYMPTPTVFGPTAFPIAPLRNHTIGRYPIHREGSHIAYPSPDWRR